MSIATTSFAIHYPVDFDERDEYEMPLKGYFSGVTVEIANGLRYDLYFYDPVRLGQDLDSSAKTGRPYLTEPNMVIVPEVTPAAIEQAVAGLVRDQFFDRLKPRAPENTR